MHIGSLITPYLSSFLPRDAL